MTLQDYEITPESSRYVLSLRVGSDPNNKKIALIFQHVSWEQALNLYMVAESSNLLEKLAEESPVSDFVMDIEQARGLRDQIDQAILGFDGHQDS